MTDFVACDQIGALLSEARGIYAQAAELCRTAEIGDVAGSSALRRAFELVEIANDLTQKAFGLMSSGPEE